MNSRRSAILRAIQSDLVCPRPYAGSISAHFDDLESKRATDRRFWRAATPRASAASGGVAGPPGPLGKATKCQAASVAVAYSPQGEGWSFDRESGELVQVETTRQGSRVVRSRDESKSERFKLQGAAGRLLPRSRTAQCLRRVQSGGTTVQVLRDREYGAVHYGGLTVCGSVWACPVCAAKISERRRVELQTAISAHEGAGGSVYLVTYTVPHGREDDLKDMLLRLREAVAAMKAHRAYKSARRRCGQVGTVRALEVTHGANGWHPHIHELWFSDSAPDKAELLRCWRSSVVGAEFAAPSDSHGVDVRDGSFAAAYASKWGLESELVKANSKRGVRGSRTPFDLLRDFVAGDDYSGALFRDYAESFHGSRQLVWSRGLKERFGLVDKSDDDLAIEPVDHADLIGELTFHQWRQVCRAEKQGYGARFSVLALAAQSWDSVLDYIQGLCDSS